MGEEITIVMTEVRCKEPSIDRNTTNTLIYRKSI